MKPTDLLAIPPLLRTVIYYALAVANVVVGAYTLAGRLDPIYLPIVSGLSGVFFGVAGSNVAAKPAGAVLVGDTDKPGAVVAPDVILVPDQPLPPEGDDL